MQQRAQQPPYSFPLCSAIYMLQLLQPINRPQTPCTAAAQISSSLFLNVRCFLMRDLLYGKNTSKQVFLEELALTLEGAVWLGEMLQTMSRMPAALVHGVFRATHVDVLPLCSIHRQARSFSCDSFLRRLSREGPQDPKSRRYLRQNPHQVSITLPPES